VAAATCPKKKTTTTPPFLSSSEWRDAADIAFIELNQNQVLFEIDSVQNPATLRFRFPSMVHALTIGCAPRADLAFQTHSTALALTSLCASADLRRVLKRVKLFNMCCADEAAAAMSAITACTQLTFLFVGWMEDKHGDVVRPDMLTSLTALTGLEVLAMDSDGAWPALPDVPSLSGLELYGSNSTFVPAGSDAVLGRLRRLKMENFVKKDENCRWAFNDPLYLRADLDAGALRPHLLTRVQELYIHVVEYEGYLEPREYDGATPAGAEWAPLASTVTKLELVSQVYDHSDLETGMYAGLGALTGLQSLVVRSFTSVNLVDFGRVHLPNLTFLSVQRYRGRSIDVARFSRLVHVEVESSWNPEPLVLSSVAALGRLASLRISGEGDPWHPKNRINLAQLFGGGRPMAALTSLSFDWVKLAWDATPVAGAPSAAEFVASAGALLPSMQSVYISEYVEMEGGVQDFVAPALRALGGG
jgi:hypothetical protein